jgi:hypothetical protein
VEFVSRTTLTEVGRCTVSELEISDLDQT